MQANPGCLLPEMSLSHWRSDVTAGCDCSMCLESGSLLAFVLLSMSLSIDPIPLPVSRGLLLEAVSYPLRSLLQFNTLYLHVLQSRYLCFNGSYGTKFFFCCENCLFRCERAVSYYLCYTLRVLPSGSTPYNGLPTAMVTGSLSAFRYFDWMSLFSCSLGPL